MCDVSGKLIAWLDRELPAEEAAEVARHLADCSECRSSVDAYKRVSREIEAYCDLAFESGTRPREISWGPVAAGAGAVAALVALFLAMPHRHVIPHAFHPPQAAVAASPAIVATAVPVSVSPTTQRVHRRQDVTPESSQNSNAAPVQNQNAYLPPNEPMIQIAIPADEMFPPGAVPEGIHFVADLTIAADGSAERLRLRPRLAGFERSTTLP